MQPAEELFEQIKELIPEEKTRTGRPREYVSQSEACEIWDSVISGESETAVAIRFRKERNVKEDAVMAAVELMKRELEIRDPELEKLKLIESTRRMIGSLIVKLHEINSKIAELDRGINYLLSGGKSVEFNPELHPGTIPSGEKFAETDRDFYLKLVHARQGHINSITRISMEMRNFNLQLITLTGSNKKSEPKQVNPFEGYESKSKEQLEADLAS
jgi:hypothetical protein